jgi:RNA polymerase sigma factor (sigma-70 family)
MTASSSSDEQEPPKDAVRGSPTFHHHQDRELAAADDTSDAGKVVDVDATLTALEERANGLELAAKHLRRTQVATLLHAARSGDDRAWELLVHRFDRVLRSVARAYRLSPPDADDAMQATWLNLHRHIGRLRDVSTLNSWLATTMRRESLRVLQLRTPEHPTDEQSLRRGDDLPGPEAMVLDAERRDMLNRALSVLPDPERRLLLALLAPERGMSYAQLGAALDMPIGSIGPVRARTMSRLQRHRQRHRELRELADTASDETDMMALLDYVDHREEDIADAPLSHASIPLDQDAAQHFLTELERLVGDRSPDAGTLERAARLVAAEQSWRDGLGLLLDEEDVVRLLGVDRRRLAELATGDELIVLTAPDGTARYPAYQFQDGRTTPTLARAHRTLVDTGHLSPWSAASWVRTSHPELELRSPVQWVGEHRDEAALLLVAERDAARSAQ